MLLNLSSNCRRHSDRNNKSGVRSQQETQKLFNVSRHDMSECFLSIFNFKWYDFIDHNYSLIFDPRLLGMNCL